MKKFLALVLALIMVATMVPALAEEPITITVWSREAESQDPTAVGSRFVALADKWNAEHEDIKINFVLAQSHDGMITAMANEGGPDIVDLLWQYAVPVGMKGGLLELSDYIKNDASFQVEDFFPNSWLTCGTVGLDGEIYAVPRSCNSATMLYNPAILKAAGYEEFPTTLEGILEAAKACHTEEVMGLNPISPWRDDVLFYAAAGVQWSDAEGNVTFDSDESRTAMKFMKDLIDVCGGFEAASEWSTTYSNTFCTTSDPIFTGGAAMRFIFDWSLASLFQAGDELGKVYGVDYAMAPLPKGMLTCATMQINAASKHPDEAWKVLSYLLSAESMADLCMGLENRGQLVPRVSALKVIQGSEEISETMKAAAAILAEGNVVNFTNSAYIDGYLSAVGTYADEYLRGYIDLEEAVELIQEEAEEAKEKAEK